IDVADRSGLRRDTAGEVFETRAERAGCSGGDGQRVERDRLLRRARHVRQDLHERVWREQIAGRQSRRITQSERRAVDAYDVDQEATLQLQTLRPAALAADLAPDRLEQLLREPVLTRLEYRRDQLRQRYGSVLDEHTSC